VPSHTLGSPTQKDNNMKNASAITPFFDTETVNKRVSTEKGGKTSSNKTDKTPLNSNDDFRSKLH